MSPIALFDLDNTLVDRQAAYRRWCEHFVEARGLDEDAVDFLCRVDDDGFAPRQHVFDAVKSHFELPDSAASMIENYRSSYFKYFQPDREVNEAIQSLRDGGWRLGVVTNGPSTQWKKLQRTGLIDLVDGVCVSDEFGVPKPDRRIFEEAIRRCTTSESDTELIWMIGDSAIPDIYGGLGAGLRTMWLDRGRVWAHADFRPDATAATLVDAALWIATGDAGGPSS